MVEWLCCLIIKWMKIELIVFTGFWPSFYYFQYPCILYHDTCVYCYE